MPSGLGKAETASAAGQHTAVSRVYKAGKGAAGKRNARNRVCIMNICFYGIEKLKKVC